MISADEDNGLEKSRPEYGGFFSLLDTNFRVESPSESFLGYSSAFMRAYGEGAAAAGAETFEVLLEADDGPAAPGVRRPPVVGVHKSKHRHWSFGGDVLSDDPRAVHWHGRGVTVERVLDLRWKVRVAPGADAALVGESVFHLLRSTALYRRNASAGPLLHASGVLDGRGQAVLFSGSVLAGKTTLLTESVIRYGATPLTNDRAAIRFGSTAEVVSWPSYASFCEGTLLNYPVLAKAAGDFESDTNPLRTIRNNSALAPAFDKDTKRIYPMSWFTDATESVYVSSAPLGTLVLTRLTPGRGRADVRELNPAVEADRAQVAAVVASESFERAEPSFLPWHGMPLPKSPWTPARIVTALADAGVRMLSLEADPCDLGVLEDFL